MTIKIFPWLLSAVLAAFLGLQIWMASGSHDRRLFENRANQIALETSKAETKLQTARADSIQAAERNKRKADSTIQAARAKVFQRAAIELKQGIDELKAERAAEGTQIDAKTAAIESKYDSLVKAQAAEIEALQVDKRVLGQSLQAEVAAVERKWAAELETSGAKDIVISDLQQEVTQERKKTKVWKIAAAVIAVGFVIEGIKD